MAEITSFFKTYDEKQFEQLAAYDYREIKRYAGIIGKTSGSSVENENYMEVLEECIKELKPVLTYRVSCRREKLEWKDNRPVFPFEYPPSKDIAVNLKGCDEAVFFAATIGIGVDRLIAKYSRISPVKALFMQAIGAERIEALCNLFNEEIRQTVEREGKALRPRYSPGYGDLSLSIQKDLMVLLDCSRRLGINLNDSLLMSPSKSVTAIIGIYDRTEN